MPAASNRRGEARRAGRLARLRPASLPAIALCAALGLLLCAIANALSREGLAPTQLIYWGGIVLIAVPVLYRLTLEDPSFRERLAVVVVFGLALYLVKVIRDPFLFTFPDEPIHAYNANQIAVHHHLFRENPLLPVTSAFPGLGGATSALMALTGMSSFGAGVVLIGAARLTFIVALFLLFARVSGSSRVAGLGVVVYAANSNFLFWGAQYAYESLALPLFVFVLAAVAEREGAAPGRTRAWAVPIVLAIAAIVVTHHLTAYALVVVLAALALVYRLWRLRRPPVWPFALLAFAVALFWLLVVADSVIGYLSPVLENAFTATLHTAAGESAPRSLFQASSSSVVEATPLLARAVSLGAVALLGVGFLAGVRRVWRGRRERPFVALFSIGAAAFFAALALRFAPAAWETGNRASEFLFIGLAFVVASAAVWALRDGPRLPGRRAAIVVALAIVLVGGAISGWPWDAQLAQPLRITADGKVIESEPLALSRWISRDLPAGKFAAGDADARLILTPGGARAKTGDALDIKAILAEPSLSNWELPLLHSHHVDYIVADRRKLAPDNTRGYFFSVPARETEPLLPAQAMHKFAEVPLGRVYDSGRIVVYNLRDRP